MTTLAFSFTGRLRWRTVLDVFPDLSVIAERIERQGSRRPLVGLVTVTLALFGIVLAGCAVMLTWTVTSDEVRNFGLLVAGLGVLVLVGLTPLGADAYARLALRAMGGIGSLPAQLLLNAPTLATVVRVYARRRLTGSQREVFAGLASDWEGSFGDLVEASRSLA